MKNISELSGKHKGEVLIVVGRGKSLERLRLEHLEGVVMAINQAIEVVESLHPDNSLYSLQKDHLFFYPKTATLLLHEREALAEIDGVDYEPAYSFDVERDFQIRWSLPSVVVAEKLGELFGCERVIYLCCDAVTDGSTETFGDAPTRQTDYLLHGDLVKQYATLPVEWKRIA